MYNGNRYFEDYGLQIYEYMVKHCEIYGYVKQDEIMEYFGYDPRNSKDDRDFRHYHCFLKDEYFNGNISHCFDSNINGLFITDGYKIADKRKKQALKYLKQYRQYKQAEDLKQQRKMNIG